MIIMRLEADNLLSFEDFKIEFSYPKKVVNTLIEEEYLISKPNFRYKKVNIFMGANASGKTSIGKVMLSIVNFLDKKEANRIEKDITNPKKKSFFSIDFLVDENFLYRVNCFVLKDKTIDLKIYRSTIAKKDSYEMSVAKLKLISLPDSNYLENLKLIPKLGWAFTFSENDCKALVNESYNKILNLKILNIVLKTLDSSISSVVKIKEAKNGYVIKTKNEEVLFNDGVFIRDNILSSGTKAGIDIAYILSSIYKNSHGFYFCDEKFSFIQSDVEQHLLSIMIDSLKPMAQLFFTTHNLDILEMGLPIHSFYFLKKENVIKVVYPTEYIKKNNQSIKNAVKNDVFDIAPDVSLLFELEGII